LPFACNSKLQCAKVRHLKLTKYYTLRQITHRLPTVYQYPNKQPAELKCTIGILLFIYSF